MSDAAEVKVVAEYVLNGPSRLKTALAVYDAYDADDGIRKTIIKAFVTSLEASVKDTLREATTKWAVDVAPDENWWWKRDCRLRVRHEVWPEGSYVGVGAAKYGPADLWFGVWGVTDQALAKTILPRVNQRVTADGWPNSNANPPLQWCYNFVNLFNDRQGELSDWKRTAAILAMHEGNKGDYHKRIHETIIAIANATDEILRGQTA